MYNPIYDCVDLMFASNYGGAQPITNNETVLFISARNEDILPGYYSYGVKI